MQQVAYTSKAAPEIGSEDIFQIVETSARKNPQRDISGFLVYDGGEFLQVVEGPEEELDRLLGELGRDTRHHSIEIIERKPIEERSFAGWTMKRVAAGNPHPETAELLARLSEHPGSHTVIQEARRLLRV